MFEAINDGHRTGYTVVNGKRVPTIRVCGHEQVIGKCKFLERDDDTGEILSLRVSLPSEEKTKKTRRKTKQTKKEEK